MREFGYEEGRNLVIEFRSADGKQERFSSLAADLVRLNVDVILAGSPPHARAAQQATRTIPIVVANLGDPIADGLAASLARPGGNVTGLTNLGVELNTKRLELLKFAIPSLTRVAAFWDSAASSPLTAKKTLDEVTSTARMLRMQVRFLRVDGPDQIARTFSPIPNETPEALLIFHSSMFFTERRRIVELVAKHQLPSMFPARDYVELGGLLAYGVKVADLFRRSAGYVHKILQGAKPADLPIEQATNFELVINAKTAKTLGIPIGESLLSRADEVIE
jgi:ABC-type uncharacterized transport system substrate-binding protein